MSSIRIGRKEVNDDKLNLTEIPEGDWNSSCNPSYTGFIPPYDSVCRARYAKSKQKYDKQFLYELKMQEAMQPSAYDAMRFHRHFAITTMWPPLHTRKEIEFFLNKMYQLTTKQQKRLNELLSQEIM